MVSWLCCAWMLLRFSQFPVRHPAYEHGMPCFLTWKEAEMVVHFPLYGTHRYKRLGREEWDALTNRGLFGEKRGGCEWSPLTDQRANNTQGIILTSPVTTYNASLRLRVAASLYPRSIFTLPSLKRHALNTMQNSLTWDVYARECSFKIIR